MSLNPSNAISERIAGIKPFKNMAGVGYQYPELVDDTLADELRAAGIHIAALPERYGEPHSTIAGELFGWEFRRAWYYWIVIGPGLPFDVATKLYEAYGKSVRVNGHCGCPSPAEEGGVPVTSYHVDNQEGLNALAATIISLNTKTDRPMPNPEKIAKFKTAHQLARELLAGPDHMMVVVLPPLKFYLSGTYLSGTYTAFPARSKIVKVEGFDAVAILPYSDALPPVNEPEKGASNAGGR